MYHQPYRRSRHGAPWHESGQNGSHQRYYDCEVGTECNPEASKPVTEEKKGLLQEMVIHTESNLNPTQCEMLFDILLEFADVFATTGDDLGHASSIKHQINTCDTWQPVR